MRFLSGLTKIMFRSTSGSPELMSESARAFDRDSSVNDETRTAGTAMIATPVRPMAEILVHVARLRGLAAR
jgi:DNA-binding IclR family transcriptional regulator